MPRRLDVRLVRIRGGEVIYVGEKKLKSGRTSFSSSWGLSNLLAKKKTSKLKSGRTLVRVLGVLRSRGLVPFSGPRPLELLQRHADRFLSCFDDFVQAILRLSCLLGGGYSL